MREDVYCGSMLKIYFYLSRIDFRELRAKWGCLHAHLETGERVTHSDDCGWVLTKKEFNIRRYESKEKYHHINSFT